MVVLLRAACSLLDLWSVLSGCGTSTARVVVQGPSCWFSRYLNLLGEPLVVRKVGLDLVRWR
jgi:hypothetical protein